MKDTFSLQEIANWQLNTANSLVELPSIQRGFVWKPKQIEDLWDSILRGYPIGSFLFSKTSNKLHLMDGQQRATSIFLGHFNPYCRNNVTQAWSIKGELPVVWLDIKPGHKPNASKYLIRLTTRSHPWGYQAKENNKPLSVSDRRKALEIFQKHPDNTEGYTSFNNNSTFPFDTWYPLPLAFFIEANSTDEIIEKTQQYLPNYFKTLRGGFENKEAFIMLLKSDLKQELEEIWKDVNNTKSSVIKSSIIEDKVLNEENEEENPTLFVRMNSSGTTLTGDDLIYSIYKSLFPEAKQLIENTGVNFIPPTQVLSLASRIVVSDLDDHAYIKKMNVSDFQRRLKNEDFKKGLKIQIETEVLQKLFEQAISILSCEKNALFEGKVPPVIIKQFIRNNQELFLFLVYWLHINKIKLTDSIKLKIAAKLFAFAWFEFDNIPKLWKEKIESKKFWEEPLNDLMWWYNEFGIHFLIEPNLLRQYYKQPYVVKMFAENNKHKWGLWEEGIGKQIIAYYKSVKSQEYDLKTANDYFWKFIGKIQHNKQLILLAQRNYINNSFGDYNQMDSVDDTNVPWDWDHIYPSEWVYRKVYCNQSIKDWNNTNGNFRALSLEQNRSESNTASPKKRLTEEEIRECSFIKEDWKYWEKIEKRIMDNSVENHFNAITTRMITIYETFWSDFKISELIIKNEDS